MTTARAGYRTVSLTPLPPVEVPTMAQLLYEVSFKGAASQTLAAAFDDA